MIELRHYQKDAVDKTIEYFQQHKGQNGLIMLPTGSGKTYVIADIIRRAREKWNVKVLVISHVKEILEQNHKSLSSYLTEEIGINSAGLGRRECKNITVAGIQSIYRQPERWQEHKLIIVDEAHLISTEQDTMYQKFLNSIGKHVCIGLTATGFRLGDGYIYGRTKLFERSICDWSSSDNFERLVREGYLSPLTTKRTQLEMDISDIKLVGGDFNEKQMSDKFNRTAVTEAAIKEILAAGRERKKWLIFAIDISHAEHIAETLIRNGIKTAPVHSKMSDSGFCRDKTIEGFKNGKYQCVVNVNILTTGFDEPGVDLIAMLRPTKSPVLHVQSLGRGCRVLDGKDNCLVLDFAGNTQRLGPINDPLVLEKGKGTGNGDPITKECPKCLSILAPAVRVCPDCGHEFKFEHNLNPTADRVEIISGGRGQWIKVDDVQYNVHAKYGSPSTLKVTYLAEGYSINEYICIEHKGFAKHKADHWVKYRGGEPCNNVRDLIQQVKELKVPNKIMVQKEKKRLVLKDSSF